MVFLYINQTKNSTQPEMEEQTTIRTSKIEVFKYNYEEYVDQKIIKKYEEVDNLFKKILETTATGHQV